MSVTGTSVQVTVRDVSPQAAPTEFDLERYSSKGSSAATILMAPPGTGGSGVSRVYVPDAVLIGADTVTLTGEAPTFMMPGCTPFVTETERYVWQIVGQRPVAIPQIANGLDLTGSVWRTTAGSRLLLVEERGTITLTIQEPLAPRSTTVHASAP